MKGHIPGILLIIATSVTYTNVIAGESNSPYDITWVVEHCFEINPPTQGGRKECEGDTYLSPGDYFRITSVYKPRAIFTMVSKSGDRIVSFPALGGPQMTIDGSFMSTSLPDKQSLKEPVPDEKEKLEFLFVDNANPSCVLVKKMTLNLLRHKARDVAGSCVDRLKDLASRIDQNDLSTTCENTNLVHWDISTLHGDARDCNGSNDQVYWSIPPEDGQGTGSGGGDSPRS